MVPRVTKNSATPWWRTALAAALVLAIGTPVATAQMLPSPPVAPRGSAAPRPGAVPAPTAPASVLPAQSAAPAPAQSAAPATGRPKQETSPRPGDRSEIDRLLERAARGDQLTDDELERIMSATPHEDVRVSLIMVPVVVLDGSGHPVPGLDAKDFTVSVDGQKRPISWFSEEMNRPFRMALLVDISESMEIEETRRLLSDALVPLAREVGLVDRMMLLSFSDQGVQQRSGWSDRPMALVQEALATPVHGRTAMVDALGTAAAKFPSTPKERQAIVLVTDGIDNASEMSVQDVIEAARKVDVPLYVLLLGDINRGMQGKRFTGSPLRALADIAEQTGGRAFLIDTRESADRAALQIRDDLRHQYWLSFRPVGASDGRFHPIEVKVHKFGASVRTRAGYR